MAKRRTDAEDARPRVSLCMIVRDEEAALPACLDAAKPFVDEIVVADTGSRDRTREIARERGARVLDVPWTEDFSAARNVSLDAATGDWVLVLDADELLSPELGAELRVAVARRDVFACFLPVVNRYDDAGRSVTALILRAWRHRPAIRFRNRIHEQTLHAVQAAAREEARRLVSLKGPLLHDGYRPEIVAARGKNERNRALFERALAENPGDLYLRWKFADFLRRDPAARERRVALLDEGVAAVRALSEKDRKDLPFAAEFFALRAEDQRAAGDLVAARAVAHEGQRLLEPTPNLRFSCAAAALASGDGAEAERGFRACLALEGAALVVPGQPGVTGFRARRGLADALLLLGRHDEARVEIERALSDGGGDEAALWEAWVVASAKAGALKTALAFATTRLKARPDETSAWTSGGRLLEAGGLVKDAATWRLRAADLRARSPRPQDVALREADLAAAAENLLRAGDLESAFARAAESRNAPRAQAVLVAVCVAAGEPTPDFVDATSPDVRAAWRRLTTVLADCRAQGRAVLDRLAAARDASPIFDPCAAALLAEA